MLLAASLLSVGATAAWGEEGASAEDLARMSLDQLANVQVTSVSKAPEPLSAAPAAIYVITHDAIMRSGASSLPEALRLAPNLQVVRVSSTTYEITARGFGGNLPDQNFPNKLLMLIDGRSVYSPLFSGIYLDAQDVLLEDVDRIEVISGPGATLWGANAMNGVINVITRPSYLTSGALLSAGVGNQQQNIESRYGGKIDTETSYRVYGLAFERDALQTPQGASADDAWWKAQGGFRIDYSGAAANLTVQGDAYHALEDQVAAPGLVVSGANLLGRWQYHTKRSEFQIQAYYDQSERLGDASGGGGWVLHTYDIELQQTLSLPANRLVWGGGERLNSYDITDEIGSATSLLFSPQHRDLTLSNLFVQDTLALSHALSFTAGIKLEDDPYAGWAVQPDARLSWALSSTGQLWAAASRAVRSPTPFDEDVIEKLGAEVFLTGNRDFHPERVNTYEVGYRAQPATFVTLSASIFYNRYDDLRTINTAAASGFLPLYWGNAMLGDTYGAELWADIQITDWWRLSPGFRSLHEQLRLEPGALSSLGIAQAGDDPSAQGELTSSMDLNSRLTFDASARYVNPLPDPALPGYYEMNARLAWRARPTLELALAGENLLHARHLEYAASAGGEAIPRSLILQARWYP